jgi:hypothetical protein
LPLSCPDSYPEFTLISLRDKLRAEGRIKELEELERPYKELWEFEKQLFASRGKAKQRKKTRKIR